MLEIIAKTDVGNVREVNQDYVQFYRKNEDECLAVLCDGMGGHNAGEVASLLAGQHIIQQYQEKDNLDSEEDIEMWMKEAVLHAHSILQQRGYEDPSLKDMGTTVVLILIKGNQYYLSHVGDSRAYYFKDHLVQLTKDDTLVNVLVDSGTISEDEAFFHPQKNILLQAVGVSDHLSVSFKSGEFLDGYMILCSDGLYNSLFNQQIEEILNLDISFEKKSEQLMKEANQFGGKDNIGFILIHKEEVSL